MKILMVNKFLYPRGGAEIYILELAAQLEKMGHQIEFFGMFDPQNTVGGDEHALAANIDFERIGISMLFRWPGLIYSPAVKRKFRQILQYFQPDIVHLNNYYYHLTPSILYAPELKGIPVIQTVHDPQMVCPNHRLYNESAGRICEKCAGRRFWACVRDRCVGGSAVKSLLAAAEGTIYKLLRTYEQKIDGFIFPSEFLKSKMGELGFAPGSRYVLHNFARKIPSASPKYDRAIYFGRLTKAKGFHTFLQAAEMLSHIHFLVAGDGPLKNEIPQYPNIEYAGIVEHEKLLRLTAESLVAIFPSESYENCPLAVTESLMAGTPVIATGLGGTAELIKEGIDGLFFQAGNPQSLRDRIQWVFDNPDKVKKMAHYAAQNGKRFNVEGYAKEFLRVASKNRNLFA